MFTGLIREKAKVVGLARAPSGVRITLEAPVLSPVTSVGDSISVDGVCLTVAEKDIDRLTFDVSRESLSGTTLGNLRAGGHVNLEDALTSASRIGGHYVLGHVDGIGKITGKKKSGNTVVMTIRVPDGLKKYLIPKGSVALDGISLTTNDVKGAVFSVTLVPHTLHMVTLGGKGKNSTVNIEVDILVKSVEQLLKASALSKFYGGGDSA